MYITEHDAAVLEEGFVLVRVDDQNVADYGEEAMWEAIQEHPFLVENAIPILIVWFANGKTPMVYGDKDLVNAVDDVDFSDITWGHTLTLEWPDSAMTKQRKPAGKGRTAKRAPSLAKARPARSKKYPTKVSKPKAHVSPDGYVLVQVQPQEVKKYGKVALATATQHYSWIESQGLPLVLVWFLSDGTVRTYGDPEYTAMVEELDFESISWEVTLTIEWSEAMTEVEEEIVETEATVEVDEDDYEEEDAEEDEDSDDEDEDEEDEEEDDDEEDEEEEEEEEEDGGGD